jgi:hypothetical protein
LVVCGSSGVPIQNEFGAVGKKRKCQELFLPRVAVQAIREVARQSAGCPSIDCVRLIAVVIDILHDPKISSTRIGYVLPRELCVRNHWVGLAR